MFGSIPGYTTGFPLASFTPRKVAASSGQPLLTGKPQANNIFASFDTTTPGTNGLDGQIQVLLKTILLMASQLAKKKGGTSGEQEVAMDRGPRGGERTGHSGRSNDRTKPGSSGAGASGPTSGSGPSGGSGASAPPTVSGGSGPVQSRADGDPANPIPKTIDMKQDISGGGPSKTTVTNNSDKPMKIAFAKNLQQGEKDPGPTVIEIPPGKTLEASLPANWAGRAWKYSGKVGDPATLAEMTFENGKTWFDASVIDGYNGPMTMGPSSGNGRTAGRAEDITKFGDAGMLTTDAAGNKVLKTTRPNSAGTSDDLGAVDFYKKYMGEDNAYIIPTGDQKAMRLANEATMAINFY